MDTSPVYLEMCSKAVEIQKLRIPYAPFVVGDFYSYYDSLRSTSHLKVADGKGLRHDDNTWLPRQDQLQEIILTFERSIGSSINSVFILHNAFFYFWDSVHYNAEEKYDTMESAWLKFAMLSQYKKMWNQETKKWEVIK